MCDNLIKDAGEERLDTSPPPYECPITKAHFDFKDMCEKLRHLKRLRDEELSWNLSKKYKSDHLIEENRLSAIPEDERTPTQQSSALNSRAINLVSSNNKRTTQGM